MQHAWYLARVSHGRLNADAQGILETTARDERPIDLKHNQPVQFHVIGMLMEPEVAAAEGRVGSFDGLCWARPRQTRVAAR